MSHLYNDGSDGMTFLNTDYPLGDDYQTSSIGDNNHYGSSAMTSRAATAGASNHGTDDDNSMDGSDMVHDTNGTATAAGMMDGQHQHQHQQHVNENNHNADDSSVAIPLGGGDAGGHHKEFDDLKKHAKGEMEHTCQQMKSLFGHLYAELEHFFEESSKTRAIYDKVQAAERSEAERLDQVEPNVVLLDECFASVPNMTTAAAASSSANTRSSNAKRPHESMLTMEEGQDI